MTPKFLYSTLHSLLAICFPTNKEDKSSFRFFLLFFWLAQETRLHILLSCLSHPSLYLSVFTSHNITNSSNKIIKILFPIMEIHKQQKPIKFSSRFKRICVFCGTSPGKNPIYQHAAIQLAEQLV